MASSDVPCASPRRMRRSQLAGRSSASRNCEKPDVADGHGQIVAAGLRRCFQRERDDFGVGGLAILAAEAFEPRLQEFAAGVRAEAEDRPEIGKRRRFAGRARGEIGDGNGQGELRPQAEFGAGGVGRQIQTAAHVLAELVEKDSGRLEDGGLGALVAGGDEMGEQRLTARFRSSSSVLRRHGANPSNLALSLSSGGGLRTLKCGAG